jgi:hypothetical protein
MITLGKHCFDVPLPRGMSSWALQQRVIPVAGRVAGVFLSLLGSTDIETLADTDVTKVLPAAMPHIGHVFSEMPQGELEAITRELLRDAKWGDEGKNPSMQLFGSPGGDAFDSVMRGRTIDTWKLLWHAIGVWYPDFFDLARAFTARKDEKANPSAASTISTQPGPASASL